MFCNGPEMDGGDTTYLGSTTIIEMTIPRCQSSSAMTLDDSGGLAGPIRKCCLDAYWYGFVLFFCFLFLFLFLFLFFCFFVFLFFFFFVFANLFCYDMHPIAFSCIFNMAFS